MCVCAGKRDVVQLATISAHRASWVDSKLDMGIQGSDLDNAGSRSDDARRLFTVPQRYTTQLRSQSEHRGSLTGSPLQPTSRQLLSRRSSRLFCTGSRQRRRRFPDHRRQIRQHQYHCQTAQELRSQNSWTRVHLRTRCQSRAQFVLDQRRTSPHSSFQCVACSSSPSLTTKFLLSLSLSLSTQFLLLSFGLGVFDGWVFLFFFRKEIGNRKPICCVSSCLAAAVTWNVTCTYSQYLAHKAPSCCVSLSTFYDTKIVPCVECACACSSTNSSSAAAASSSSSPPYLLEDSNLQTCLDP